MGIIRIILVLILILVIIWISFIKEKRKKLLEKYSNLGNTLVYNDYKNIESKNNKINNTDNIDNTDTDNTDTDNIEVLGEDIYKKDNNIQIKKGNHKINIKLESENYNLKEEECTININNYIDNKVKNIDYTKYVEKVSIFDGLMNIYQKFKSKYINLSDGFFH